MRRHDAGRTPRPGRWPLHDADAIVALFADSAVYRSPMLRDPDRGRCGVRRYVTEQFSAEETIESWFGTPIVAGNRPVVEWWASWREDGRGLSYAGVTVLRFDDAGQAVEHRTYFNDMEGRKAPFDGW